MVYNEERVLKGCCKGKSTAQRQLYEHFAPKMLVVSLRYTSGRLEAEDVLQEAFIKVFDKIPQFRKECPLEAWIKRIVINTALKQNRSKLYLYPAIDIDDLQEQKASEWSVNQYSWEELLAMIQQLAPRYRAVFNLYAIEGYQHKEIAEMLNITEGTSKSQYARAKILLREMLQKEEDSAYGRALQN
ncbi:MAG: RNA polymerase sigma factor [Thermonemataceae bacterium]